MHNTVLPDIRWNMLIKFSKQIGKSIAKIINTKVNSGPSETSEMELELFRQVFSGFTGEQNFVKHLRWSFFQKWSKTKSCSLFL